MCDEKPDTCKTLHPASNIVLPWINIVKCCFFSQQDLNSIYPHQLKIQLKLILNPVAHHQRPKKFEWRIINFSFSSSASANVWLLWWWWNPSGLNTLIRNKSLCWVEKWWFCTMYNEVLILFLIETERTWASNALLNSLKKTSIFIFFSITKISWCC